MKEQTLCVLAISSVGGSSVKKKYIFTGVRFRSSTMALVGDVELRSLVRVERVGAHSHIRGLGVGANFDPEDVADGMVGQIRARRAAAIIVKMIQV